jgi:hypothetical protein
MLAKILSAADDARFVESGRRHRLRLYQISGFWKAAISQNPIHQCLAASPSFR